MIINNINNSNHNHIDNIDSDGLNKQLDVDIGCALPTEHTEMMMRNATLRLIWGTYDLRDRNLRTRQLLIQQVTSNNICKNFGYFKL